MQKQQINHIINQLELVKSLITEAQGKLEDGKESAAMESLMAAQDNLAFESQKLFSNIKGGGRSTEHM